MAEITVYTNKGATKHFGAQYVIEEILLAYVMNDAASENSIFLGIDKQGNARWREGKTEVNE